MQSYAHREAVGKLGTGPCEYVINGQKLEVVTKEKDLGMQ